MKTGDLKRKNQIHVERNTTKLGSVGKYWHPFTPSPLLSPIPRPLLFPRGSLLFEWEIRVRQRGGEVTRSKLQSIWVGDVEGEFIRERGVRHLMSSS